jgi:hypothetical protein
MDFTQHLLKFTEFIITRRCILHCFRWAACILDWLDWPPLWIWRDGTLPILSAKILYKDVLKIVTIIIDVRVNLQLFYKISGWWSCCSFLQRRRETISNGAKTLSFPFILLVPFFFSFLYYHPSSQLLLLVMLRYLEAQVEILTNL